MIVSSKNCLFFLIINIDCKSFTSICNLIVIWSLSEKKKVNDFCYTVYDQYLFIVILRSEIVIVL